MKKYFLSLSVLFVALFIGVIKANAEITVFNGNCMQTDQGTGSICNLIIVTDANSTIKNGTPLMISLENPVNIKDNKVTIELAEGWQTTDGLTTKEVTLSSDSEVKLELKYTGSQELSNTNVTIGVGKYNKDIDGDECGFEFGLVAPSCSVQPSKSNPQYYYGKDGQYLGEGEEAKAQYYKECYYCTVEDGKYYGLNGQETDEATYNKECTNICKKEDGKYFCKDGKECTKEDYENECAKNPNQGAFLPIAGIIAGVALIGVSTIMVRKQSKLRKL